MSPEQFSDCLRNLPGGPDDNRLAGIATWLRDQTVYQDSNLTGHFTLTRHLKDKALSKLSTHLITFLRRDIHDVNLDVTTRLVRSLMDRREYEAAADLIRLALPQAMETEEFAIIVDLWKLGQNLPLRPFTIHCISLKEAELMEENELAYKALIRALEKIIDETDEASKTRKLEEIRDHERLSAPQKAISRRAAYWFWKAKALCFTLLQNPEKAIGPQREVVNLITNHPWITKDGEYGLLREIQLLYAALLDANQLVEARNLIHALNQMQFTTPRALVEIIYMQYPFLVLISMQLGEFEVGVGAINKFLALMEQPELYYPAHFVTHNLYVCLYFCLVIQNTETAYRFINHLRKYTKKQFEHPYLAFTKLLEIIYHIEVKEWPEALQQIKNLKSWNLSDIPKLHEILLFLDRSVKRIYNKIEPSEEDLSFPAPDSLKAELENDEVLRYFDFLSWLEAKNIGCEMIDVFQVRAMLKEEES
jgi:hypothetical protein